MPTSSKQVVGGLGSLVLLVGTFAPYLSFPQFGYLFLFRYGCPTFLVLVLAGIASVAMVLADRTVWLWVVGLASLAASAWSNYAARLDLVEPARALANLRLPPGASPFFERIVDEGRFSVGAYFLLLGPILLLATAALSDDDGSARESSAFDSSRIGNAGKVIRQNLSGSGKTFLDVGIGTNGTKIDAVAITRAGVYPIAVKHYRGRILSPDGGTWTQEVEDVRKTIPDPRAELSASTEHLRRLLGAQETWFRPLVALVGEPQVDKPLPTGVHFLAEALSEIENDEALRYDESTRADLERRLSKLASPR